MCLLRFLCIVLHNSLSQKVFSTSRPVLFLKIPLDGCIFLWGVLPAGGGISYRNQIPYNFFFAGVVDFIKCFAFSFSHTYSLVRNPRYPAYPPREAHRWFSTHPSPKFYTLSLSFHISTSFGHFYPPPQYPIGISLRSMGRLYIHTLSFSILKSTRA